MLNLDYSSGDFSLVGSPENASLIIQGRHRIFFAIQLNGIQENEEGWIIPAGDNLKSTYIEITTYLTRHRIEYQLLSGCQSIHDDILEQQRIFTEARVNALAIKQSDEIIDFKPPNFKDRTLHHHQTLSANHLLNVINGANFSVPGSGKTTVVYAVYDYLKTQETIDGLLVIGPPSSFMAWNDEYESCFSKKGTFARIAGISPDERDDIYRDHALYDVFLTTYQTAYRDVDKLIRLTRQRKLMVVLDESHYVKRMEGGRYANAVLRIAPNAVRRVVLTGTPMPNNHRDLWTQITFLWPDEEVLGDQRQFARQVDVEAIREDINPFFIRINKEALQLPEPTIHNYSITMNEHQNEIYQALAVNTLEELDYAPSERVELMRWRRGKIIRLLQAACNPSLLMQSSVTFNMPPLDSSQASIIDLINSYPSYEMPSKMQKTIELTYDLINKGKKVLIWTWFVHNIAMITSAIQDLNPLEIHGGIPRDESINEERNREASIRTFLSSTDYNVLVANPSACAESISLHSSCHDAIYLDRTFNCGQYLQSLDRIHRIGLAPDQETNYHIFSSKGTIDEVVKDRLIQKERQMRLIIDEDLPSLSLDIESEDPSDENLEEDFEKVIESLRRFTEDG